MATKTISIDLETYERLSRAKLSAGDSFSRVIKRAKWETTAKTCGELLQSLAGMPMAADDVLERLERAQAEDKTLPGHARQVEEGGAFHPDGVGVKPLGDLCAASGKTC